MQQYNCAQRLLTGWSINGQLKWDTVSCYHERGDCCLCRTGRQFCGARWINEA